MTSPGSASSPALTSPGSPARIDPLDLDWALDAHAEETEVGGAVAHLLATDTPSADDVSRLLAAIRSIDLTTLSGDDTPERVRALCARARQPLPEELAERLGPAAEGARVAAVCVYHHFVDTALRALEGSGVPVAVAAGGFPAGLSALRTRIDEVHAAVQAGAGEIDVVINRSLALTGEWEGLYAELAAFRQAAGAVPLKVILATGELGSLRTVARVARLCLQAGADFIKTSTGKEEVNATYPAGLVMLREIAGYRQRTGREAGFKPAGGIRTPEQALQWQRLVEKVVGESWLEPERFRIGASGLLGSIVRRLEQHAAGNPQPPAGPDAPEAASAY